MPGKIASPNLSAPSLHALRAERHQESKGSSFWNKWSNLSTGQKWGRGLAWVFLIPGIGIQIYANRWQAKVAAARPRENLFQQSNKNINNIPLRSHAVFGADQRAKMTNELASHKDIQNPTLLKGEEKPSFEGLADTFEKDVNRGAEVHLEPSSGEGVVTINKDTMEPGTALRNFFKKEFPNNEDTAEKWSVLTSKYANQITLSLVSGANTEASGFRCTGNNSQQNYFLRMEQGGNSALLESRAVGGIQNIIAKDGKSFVAVGFDGIDWENSNMEETLLLRLKLGPPESAEVISAFTKHNLVEVGLKAVPLEEIEGQGIQNNPHDQQAGQNEEVDHKAVPLDKYEGQGIQNNPHVQQAGLNVGVEILNNAGIHSEADLVKLDQRKETADSITSNDSDIINRNFLGGGNAAFKYFFDNPKLLDENVSREERRENYEPFLEKTDKEAIQAFTYKIQQGFDEGIDEAIDEFRSTLDSSRQERLNIELDNLDDPTKRAILRNYIHTALQNKLTVTDAMSVIRGHDAYKKADIEQSKNIARRVLESQNVTPLEVANLGALFPPMSS